MGISIYVDGSGGTNSGFGYFVKETGESFYEKKPELTNNQAEYLAIISALNKYVDSDDLRIRILENDNDDLATIDINDYSITELLESIWNYKEERGEE